MPVQDHYVFRMRRRWHGTLTVSAEGQIWQDETDCVIVEGETRVNGWSWIAPLVIMSLIGWRSVRFVVAQQDAARFSRLKEPPKRFVNPNNV